jgi:hypothetical protein
MIHWRKEGSELRQGLSFYHPKDEGSAGVWLRIGYRRWFIRYSKITKKWYCDYAKVDPDALANWEAHHGYKK